MGMLDDAIREHLELKRLRGADPAEVAREEHAALGPVRRDGELVREDETLSDTVGVEPDDGAAATSGFEASDPDDEPTTVGTGQETVEINMDAELSGESAAAQQQAGGRAAPVGHPAHTQPSSGESLEWEMPSDRAENDDGPTDDQAADNEELAEDVLEETPDFLRETPEQERLWFEQRPPRDFDFNE
ncbi:MAG TPA: hypothetical protein VFJ24_05320 [Gaiellales bacterium]|nr:hypothetical protein [Gaiellales bacterium]